MNKRVVIGLWSVALVLALVNLWSYRRHSQEEPEQRLRRRLVSLPLAQIQELELAGPDGQLLWRLDRSEQGRWQVASPYQDRAKRSAIDEVKALLVYGRSEAVTISPDQAGLEHPQAELTLRTADDSHRVIFGGLSDDRRWRYLVLSQNMDRLFKVPATLVRFLAWPATAFREMRLFPSDVEQALLIAVDRPSEDQVVLKREGGGWQLRKPVVWEADPQAVTDFLQYLSNAQGRDVVEEPAASVAEQPSVAKTSKGEVRLSFVYANREETVRLARDSRDESRSLAHISGRTAVLSVPDQLRRRLYRLSADSLRIRALPLLGDKEQVAEVSLRTPHEVIRLRNLERELIWKGISPHPFTVDVQQGKRLRGFLRAFQVDGFVPASMQSQAEAALSQPLVEVQVLLQSGRRVAQLRIGQALQKKLHVLQVADRDTLFWLSADKVRLLRRRWFHWRLRQLCYFDLKDPVRLEIRQEDRQVVYERTMGDAWQQVLPQTVPADNRALYFGPLSHQGLGGLAALGFVAEISAGKRQFGLDPPWMNVVVDYALPNTGEGKSNRTLERLDVAIGKPATHRENLPTSYYAQLRNGRLVFRIDARIVEMLRKEYGERPEKTGAGSQHHQR